MKKKVSFEKKVHFPTMIGEISAISLEHNLHFVDESNMDGFLILTGKYKQTEASRLEEEFSYQIPTEISLTEKLDVHTVTIEISDFSYEIQEDSIVCHIELTIEGLEIITDDENRECDGDPSTPIVEELPVLEKKEMELLEESNNDDNDSDSFSLFDIQDDSETYGTFVVYIVRQNESIQSIIEKYHTSLEEVEKYNDIHNVNIGSKLIIPLLNE